MKKKVLFGITSLTLGGAERVLVDLSNALCEKYDITIFTIYSNGELEKQLNKKIKLKSLYSVMYSELSWLKKHFFMPLRVFLFKKKIYNKIKGDYDVEISFLEGPVTRILSCKNKKVKKIAWIHNDISLVFGKTIKSKLKKIIDKKIYLKYEMLIFVSKDNLKKFNNVYKNEKIKKIKKEVIYNYIDQKSVILKSEEEQYDKFGNENINFVTVARLVPQKGIDRLINVHSKLINNGLKNNFYVIGDGPEYEKLKNMIKNNRVEETFHLLGKKENPYPYIKNADYFCLLSYFEGYGMVLEEAKILNKSIIITNTAAREAVLNYDNAVVLENDEDSIYAGLKKILQQVDNHKNYKKTNYCNKKILEQISKLIQ